MTKYQFANIPGVPGCMYYFTIKGKNRSLVCISNENKRVQLADLDTGFPYNWDIAHFSYMLRNHRWKDPGINSSVEKIEVEHTERPAFMTREYTEKDFDGLIDDIDNVTF